jgi:hypothetical protein
MAASPVDAISKAVERSKQLLFPFKPDKWFALGFTVFMAQCSEGGGGGSSFNMPGLPSGGGGGSGGGGSGGGGSGPSLAAEIQKLFDEAWRALQANLGLYLLLGASALLLLLGVWLFIIWFSSRAKLMFVESVVWDRVDVSSQWSRAAELGLSLFKFRLALSLAVWVLGLASLAAAAIAGLPDFRSGDFLGTRALIAYSILACSVLFVYLPLGIVASLLEDFVVPLMVVRNARVLDAWGMCRAEVLAGNIGGVFVFYLLRFVLGMAMAIVITVLSCVTCCLTAIPYLGTVLLLPVWVFSRAFPLYYLEQLGITVFPQSEPTWAAYDRWRFPT